MNDLLALLNVLATAGWVYLCIAFVLSTGLALFDGGRKVRAGWFSPTLLGSDALRDVPEAGQEKRAA